MKISSFVVCAALCAVAAAPARAQHPRLKVVLAVRLQNPDVVLRYAKVSAKNVPVIDFDFRAAFADELMTRFSAATAATAEWRVATAADSVPLILFQKDDQKVLKEGLNAFIEDFAALMVKDHASKVR